MKLKEIAHARTGDKGEISNISVIPYDENNYEMLKEKVTEARVAEYFREICHGKVTRYELDGIHALNFVLDKTLGGGVTRSLALDKHGKTLGMALLEMEDLGQLAEDFMAAVGKTRGGTVCEKRRLPKAVQHLKEKTARSRCAMV